MNDSLSYKGYLRNIFNILKILFFLIIVSPPIEILSSYLINYEINLSFFIKLLLFLVLLMNFMVNLFLNNLKLKKNTLFLHIILLLVGLRIIFLYIAAENKTDYIQQINVILMPIVCIMLLVQLSYVKFRFCEKFYEYFFIRLFFLFLGYVALLQFYLNSNIFLDGINYTKNIMVTNSIFTNNVRSPSLYYDPLFFGKLFIPFVFFYLVKTKTNSNYSNYLFFFLGVLCLYVTQIRANYLHFVFSFIFFHLWKNGNLSMSKIYLYNILLLILFPLLLFTIPNIIFFQDYIGILNSNSLIARLNHWESAIYFLQNMNFFEILFGIGISQVEDFNFDNFYLNAIPVSGIFFLFISLYIIHTTLKISLEYIRINNNSASIISIILFMCPLPFIFLFHSQFNSVFIMIAILLLLLGNKNGNN